MKHDDPCELRKKSLNDLCEWIGGFNETTSGGRAKNFLGQFELKRRLENPNAIRSWIAIIISAIALLVVLIDVGIKIVDHQGHSATTTEEEHAEPGAGR